MKSITIETVLPTDADRLWRAIQHPVTLSYVCKGLLGFPALAGRTEPVTRDESGTGWVFLFHVIPISRLTIHVAELDDDNRTLCTNEWGGALRTWNQTMHVVPINDESCRYTDTLLLDAGPFTSIVALFAHGFYRYRQKRLRKLVCAHLLPSGPKYARPALSNRLEAIE